MNDRQLSLLKTGVLFVAPGQIMDPGIMKLPHNADHLSRLRADVGLDVLEAELASIGQCGWSFRQVLAQIRRFITAKRFSHTPTHTGTVRHHR